MQTWFVRVQVLWLTKYMTVFTLVIYLLFYTLIDA